MAKAALNPEKVEDERTVWTPVGNQSLKDMKRVENLYKASGKGGFMNIIGIAKYPNATDNPNILSRGTYQELIDFEQDVLNGTYLEMNFNDDFGSDSEDEGQNMTQLAWTRGNFTDKKLYWKDICKQEAIDQDQDLKDGELPKIPLCIKGYNPLNFIYEQDSGEYNLTRYETNGKLLGKIQSGKGDPEIYGYLNNIYVEALFGKTKPEKITQDARSGKNDIENAKATTFGYFYSRDRPQNKGLHKKWYFEFERKFNDRVKAFAKKSKYITCYSLTIQAFIESFSKNIGDDFFLIFMSIVLVSVYTVFVLGGCSPVHFRMLVAGVGLFCIVLAYMSCQYIAFALGHKFSNIHSLLPFLLLGIGVDDMFVVCNAVDQTDINESTVKRMRIAMSHAGPSITITSFTNAVAFFFGSSSSMISLQSFCMFAGLAILMLYYAVLTVFSATLVLDLRRQAKLRADCCGLCCCSERSIFCCRGYFLSPAQKKFSDQKGDKVCCPKIKTPNAIENAKEGWCCCCCCMGKPPTNKHKLAELEAKVDPSESEEQNHKPEFIKCCFCFSVIKRGANTDSSEGEDKLASKQPVKQEQELEGGTQKHQDEDHIINDTNIEEPAEEPKPEKLYTSCTEKFLDKYFVTELMSKEGRITVLALYFVLTVFAIYGARQLRVDFSIDYFVDDGSYIKNYLDANKAYFKAGSPFTIYVENPDLDYSSQSTQLTLQNYFDKLQRCAGCKESWVKRNSVASWYAAYYQYVYGKKCKVLEEWVDDNKTLNSQHPTVKWHQYIDQKWFYPCLEELLKTKTGDSIKNNIRWNSATPGKRKIIGFKSSGVFNIVSQIATQGPGILRDMRRIQADYGLPGTFTFAEDYLDYESYFNFVSETLYSSGMSFAAVCLVILVITTSITATLLVALCVALVDLYLLALLYFWGLTFNTIVVLQIVIALGLAVDYSAHIAHNYLVIVPPPGSCNTNAEKRIYKVKAALSQIGSSIFHGGFSTFLAICMLGGSKSYIFVVFFRAWFGIITFGLANGFILLPVLLSLIGPTAEVGHVSQDVEEKQVAGDNNACCARHESSESESDFELTSPKAELEGTLVPPLSLYPSLKNNQIVPAPSQYDTNARAPSAAKDQQVVTVLEEQKDEEWH